MTKKTSATAAPGRTRLRSLLLVLGIVLLAANLRPALTGVAPLIGQIRADTSISNGVAGLLIPFRVVDGIMGGMAKILYTQAITEDPNDLKELEKRHRYSHLFQRLRMLRLLKSGECSNLGEAAQALGYSWRQCQRWFATYKEDGIEELLKSRVHE